MFRLAALLSVLVIGHAWGQSGRDSRPQPRVDANVETAGLAGWGACEALHDACITPAQRAVIMQRIAANRQALGLVASQGAVAGAAAQPLFPFFPQGGTPYRDVIDSNYVDLDPATPGILDYVCAGNTYDFHAGIDRVIRTFTEQSIGVPVFAALDGVVIDAVDGEFDMNTSGAATAGNYLIIDHGLGFESWYFHLKNGSVLPAIGDFVKAGEQIGLTASSGNSTWPHLHFETRFLGSIFEPFAGPCRAGDSGWENQTPFVGSMYLIDFGISNQNPVGVTQFPTRPHADSQIATTDPNLYFWFLMGNLQANTTWRVVYMRPNGTTSLDSGTLPFNNPNGLRFGWTFFNYQTNFIPDLTTTPGTWHVDLYLGGQLMVHAPFEVVTSIDPGFNRPPQPISAAFDPVSPSADDVIFCRVTAPILIADLDYDVVRFHYVWKINGGTVRDITSAGHADALPRNMAQAGDTVSVTVTANDGTVDGTPVMISLALGEACIADIVSNATFEPPPDGIVDGADLGYLLSRWGNCN